MSFLGWCLYQQSRIAQTCEQNYQVFMRRRFRADAEYSRDVLWQNFERHDHLTKGIARDVRENRVEA